MTKKPLLTTLALAGALLTAGGARAQDAPSTGGRAVGSLFDALGLRKPVPPSPDFVRESRPEGLDYLPLSPTPERTAKDPAADLQAAGASLDRAAAQAKRRAARVKVPN